MLYSNVYALWGLISIKARTDSSRTKFVETMYSLIVVQHVREKKWMDQALKGNWKKILRDGLVGQTVLK